ncbi:MAG: glycosyltransferase family 2 protein [Nitrospinota bacterium]|nr:glycosyltransferase family 2 protein [Nitrospinota bacterium]
MVEFSIVIPFFNEEPNVEGVLKEIIRLLADHRIDYEIIAVNNGSTDGTGEIIETFSAANDRVKILSVPVNQGYGNGILEGLKKASGRHLGYSDGDGQNDGESIVGCYKELQISPELELAKGVPRKIEENFFRKFVSKVYNFLVSTLFGIEATGINCKPKIFTRQLYEKLNPESKDWFIDAEIMIKCTRMNVRYVEYPIKVLQRKEGASHVSPKTIVEFLFNFLRYLFK